MENSRFFENKLYISLYNHSKKHIPYKWLAKIGIKNITPQKFSWFALITGFNILSASLIYILISSFKNYPDKTPILLFSLLIAALSAFLSNFKMALLVSGIISLELYFLLSNPNGYLILLIQLIFFISVSVVISYLIQLAKKSDEVRRLKERERSYAIAFTKLSDEHKAALWKIKARDEFLSIISHELKTPLTVMLLKLSDMLNSIRNVSMADFSIQQLTAVLENSQQQIKWINSMISELLDVSLITTGRMNLNLTDTDLVKITKQVKQSFSEMLKQKKYKVTVHGQDAVKGKWDRVKIEQAITNLFSNAIKYGAGKPVNIKITQDRSWAKFIISDGGMGISPEDQKVIFDLFKRASGSGEYKKGLGIGLFITSQIIKVHGGKIKVSSALGKGTTFTIALPLKRS
ncbi:HAMP domain-containing histidine kinase [Candidatus Daviesbacteria bacterium]|nr:HAMP domain-containing histidine kinase [Candidatus Daviesbacteria bacterium]